MRSRNGSTRLRLPPRVGDRRAVRRAEPDALGVSDRAHRAVGWALDRAGLRERAQGVHRPGYVLLDPGRVLPAVPLPTDPADRGGPAAAPGLPDAAAGPVRAPGGGPARAVLPAGDRGPAEPGGGRRGDRGDRPAAAADDRVHRLAVAGVPGVGHGEAELLGLSGTGQR